MDGKIYHVPHFSCGTAECIAQGANVDYSDLEAQSYARALDAKALDDFSKAMTLGVAFTPVGQIGSGVAIAGTGASLLSGYLREEITTAGSKEALMIGFEAYAKARGLSAVEARRFNATLDSIGIWNRVVTNGKDMLGLDDE